MSGILLSLLVSFAGRSWPLTPGGHVDRIWDEETGVVCYVIPQNRCYGDCAYSPAISCVKVK